MISLLSPRQVISEILFVFDAFLLFILIRYLLEERRRYEKWWKQYHLQGAVALSLLIFGHLVVRGWSIATFVLMARGRDIFALENALPVAFAGTLFSVIGMCWLVRIFSPAKWKDRGWFVAIITTIAFVVLMEFVY